MAGVLGQFSNGPIQFNADTGAIESRGTIDRPQPSVTQAQPTPAPAPQGGGVLTAMPSSLGRSGGGGSGANFLGPKPFGGPSNGGSYGMGGMGNVGALRSLGGGGLDGGGEGTGAAFEDGGEVGGDYSDGMDDQGAASATVDPMAVIKQAASFGRKQFGLPTNFSTGQSEPAQMGFEDGGMIPEEGAQPVTADGNSSGMPDPRKALAYLAGDGAVSPEIAHALEQHVDPQGQMDPAERTMAAITAAPNDEAKFGLMQHYRTRFNAYSGGARAALDRGDLGQAAMNATNAFAAVPTGQKIKFAPAQGGIAVMASKIGDALRGALTGRTEPAPPGGESVVNTMKRTLTGKAQPGYEAGGWVDPGDQYRDLPESDNIEDRRNEREEDKKQKPSLGSAARKIGRALSDSAGDWARTLRVDKLAPNRLASEAGYDDAPTGGVLGFEDGGEVEEDDGVIPEAPVMEDTGEADMGGVPAEQPVEDATGQPTVLTTDQFKKLMQAGYDKPVDEGWEGLMNSIMNFIGPSSAEAAGLKPEGGTTVMPKTKGDKLDVSPALQRQMDTPTPLSQVAAPQAAQPAEGRDAKHQALLERAEKTAQQIFPWASQGEQRRHYIEQMMSKAADTEGKVDVVNAQGKGLIAQQREQGRQSIEQMKELGRNNRQANAAHSREEIARMNNTYKQLSAAQREFVRLQGQQLMADPALASNPNRLTQRVTQMAAQLGIQNPGDLLAIIQNGGQPPAAPAAPTGGGRNPIGDTAAASVGAVRPYTKNGVTKQYKFGSDGLWHLMQ